jgi:hypothetical protein
MSSETQCRDTNLWGNLIARRFKILRKEGDTKDNLCVRSAL